MGNKSSFYNTEGMFYATGHPCSLFNTASLQEIWITNNGTLHLTNFANKLIITWFFTVWVIWVTDNVKILLSFTRFVLKLNEMALMILLTSSIIDLFSGYAIYRCHSLFPWPQGTNWLSQWQASKLHCLYHVILKPRTNMYIADKVYILRIYE